jgi:hypothetical protein
VLVSENGHANGESRGDFRGPVRTESGLTETQELILERKAIIGRWQHGERYNTFATKEELEKRAVSAPLSARDKSVLTAHKGMDSQNEMVQQRAVANVVAMDKVNQRDEENQLEIASRSNPVNVPPVNLQVVVTNLLSDAEYLEYRRNRALATDSGAVCQNGQPRQMEDGPTPGATRPGNNGHNSGD